MTQQFSATVYRSEGWLCIEIPFDVNAEYGTRACTAVNVVIGQSKFKTSIFPMGNGKHFKMINKTMKMATGAHKGDTISIRMDKDSEPRELVIPADVAAAISKNAEARKVFEEFSCSHKKELLDHILEAKKTETRQRRIQKTVEFLKQKNHERN